MITGHQVEGLPVLLHQTRESGSSSAGSVEQAAELHHDGACAFQQLTEFFILHSH